MRDYSGYLIEKSEKYSIEHGRVKLYEKVYSFV